MPFSLAQVIDTIASANPDRDAIVIGNQRYTNAQLHERCRRLANYLLSQGLVVEKERDELEGHESGQAHLALYLYNGNEYIEGMFGAFKARVAPLNVNYRYVEEELLYLFDNSESRGVIYHAEFAPQIAAIRDRLPKLEVLIQVADDSGNSLLPGAVDYEEALAQASAEEPPVDPSPDDLYILYTGGTTGMPKGVLWRQDDIFVGAMGGRRQDGTIIESPEALAEQASAGPEQRSLCGPPLMHGAAQWGTVNGMTTGTTAVFASEVRKFDARNYLEAAERERVIGMTIVGDAFARPIVDELRTGDYDLSSLNLIANGGASLSQSSKEALLEIFPTIVIIDGMGSSEGGTQGMSISTKGNVNVGKFNAAVDSVIVSEDLSKVLDPSDASLGWLAMRGRKPLGYFRDAEKTARTFPTIEGQRYSVPGDRASYREDGGIDLLGRDSMCINSGGEKIFAEEVEEALKCHADVFDTLVAPRPSDRWGQEVVAVVALREGASPDEAALRAEVERHVARYKLPKVFVFVDAIQRSPSGKADYRWAKAQAEASA
ncbi:MAG: acyl-CoA synthetase [Myxococcota bacterium]|nr:acyl-CoA synthetase [Myxococcota bacterium]